MNHFLPFIFAILLFISCSETEQKENLEPTQSEQAYELVKVDSINFRRAYHGHDTLEGKERDIFMNRNPEWCGGDEAIKNTVFYKGLVEEGIILDGNLNLSKIDTLPDQFVHHYSPTKKFGVKTRRLDDPKMVDMPSYELTIFDQQRSILVDTLGFGFPPDVTFFTRDLNADGKDELCALFRWYIVNGDNFDLTIYNLDKTISR